MAIRRMTASGNVLLLLCVMYFVTYMDRVNVSTAAAAFKSELSLSNTQLGLVFSAFAYPYLACQVIGGWFGDRFGARRTLTVCGLIWAGATILTGFVGGVTGYEYARNVTLDIGGTLAVTSGIVAANAETGKLSVTAQSITSDGATALDARRK